MKRIKSTLVVILLSLGVSSGIDAKTAPITYTINGKQIATGSMHELKSLLDESKSIKEQFDSILKNKRVFLDCYMPNCGPCKKIKPELEKLAKKYTDILFIAVNTNEFSEIATKYNIRSAPTCIFLENGKIVRRNVGEATKSELEDLVS